MRGALRILPVFFLLFIPFTYSDACADCHSIITLTSTFNESTNETTVFALLVYTNETYLQTVSMDDIKKVIENMKNNPDWVPNPNIPSSSIPVAGFSPLPDANITFALIDYSKTPPEINITNCVNVTTDANGVASCTFNLDTTPGGTMTCQNLQATFYGLPDRGIREGSSTLLICPQSYIPARSIGTAIADVLATGSTTTTCLPLFIVAGFLLASLFLAGKEPFAIFDITTPHMPHVKKFPFVRTFVWEGWAFQRRQFSAQTTLLLRIGAGLLSNYGTILRQKGVSSGFIDKIMNSKVSNEQKLMAMRMLSLGYGRNKVEQWLKKKVVDEELAKWNRQLYDEAKKAKITSAAERQALDASASNIENSIALRTNIESLQEKTHVGHKVGQIPLVHMVFDAIGGMKEQSKWVKDGAKTVGVLLPLYALRGTGSIAGKAGAPNVKKTINNSKVMKWLENDKRNPEKAKIGRLEDAEKKIENMKELVALNMKQDIVFSLLHKIVVDKKGTLSSAQLKKHEDAVRNILQEGGELGAHNIDAKIQALGNYLKTQFGEVSGSRAIGLLNSINGIYNKKGQSNLEVLKGLYEFGDKERKNSGVGSRGFNFMTGKQLTLEELKNTLADKEYLRQLVEGQHPELVSYDDVKNFINLSITDEEQGLGCYQTKSDKTGNLFDFAYEKLPWGPKRKYGEPRPMVDLEKKEKTARQVLSLLADKVDGKDTVVNLNGKFVRKSDISAMLTKELADATHRAKGNFVREDRPWDKNKYTPIANSLVDLLRTGSDRFKLDVAYDWKVSRAGGPPSDARLGLSMGPAGARLSVYDLLIGRYKYGTLAIDEPNMKRAGENLLYNRLISRLGGIEYGADLYGVEGGRFGMAPQGFNPLSNFIDRNENIMKEYWRRVNGKTVDPTSAELRRFSTSAQYKDFIKGGATLDKINKGMWVATPEGTFAPLYGPMMATGEADKQINTLMMVKEDGRWVRYRPLTHDHAKLKGEYDSADVALMAQAKDNKWNDQQLANERTNLFNERFKMVPKSDYSSKYGPRGAIYGGWSGLGKFADALTVGSYMGSMNEMQDHLAVTTHYNALAFKLFRDIGMDKYQQLAGPMRYLDEKKLAAESRYIREGVPRRNEKLNEALKAYASEWPGLGSLATTTITGRDARTQSTSYGIRQTFRGLSHTGQAMFSGPTTFADRGATGSAWGEGIPGMRGRLARTVGRAFQMPYIATATALQASYAPVLGALTLVRTPLEYMMGYPHGAYDQMDQPIKRKPSELMSMFTKPAQLFDWELVPYYTSQFKVAGRLNPFSELFARRMPGEYERTNFGMGLLDKFHAQTKRFGASMKGGYYSEIGKSGTDKYMDGVRRPMEVWPDAKGGAIRQHTIPVSAGFAYSTARFYTPLYPRVAEWIKENPHMKALSLASDMVDKSANMSIQRRGIEYAASGIDPRVRTAAGQLIEREEEFGIYSPIHYPTSMAFSPAFIPWFGGGRVITDAVSKAASRARSPTGAKGGFLKEAASESFKGIGRMVTRRPRRERMFDETGTRPLSYMQDLHHRFSGNVVQCPNCGATILRGSAHHCPATGTIITDYHHAIGKKPGEGGFVSYVKDYQNRKKRK